MNIKNKQVRRRIKVDMVNLTITLSRRIAAAKNMELCKMPSAERVDNLNTIYSIQNSYAVIVRYDADIGMYIVFYPRGEAERYHYDTRKLHTRSVIKLHTPETLPASLKIKIGMLQLLDPEVFLGDVGYRSVQEKDAYLVVKHNRGIK